MSIPELPILYGTATNGKTKVWSIRVFEEGGNGVIEVSHGYEGGKMQITQKVVEKGKNIGKKNETTAVQQAYSEAHSTFMKKRESGYTPLNETSLSEEKIVAEKPDSEEKESTRKAIDEFAPSPMLAHDYNKRGKSIVFPCYIQPKLDGTRTVYQQGKLFSRNRKPYPHLKHIIAELSSVPLILDGELYSDSLTFQEIVGIVKRETLSKDDEKKQTEIQFHVYDVINDQPFEQRLAILKQLARTSFRYIRFVLTEECASETAMKEKHAEYVAQGFEGIMLRNKRGPYAFNRSVHLKKYKEFFDEECKIVGYKQGEGLEAGCVIWICQIDGKTFSCRPRGSREEREEMFTHGDQYVGKLLTVRYQEKTDDGLLRFPVGIAIRDYE